MYYLHIDAGKNKGHYTFNTLKEKDAFMEAHSNDKRLGDYWYSYDDKVYVNYLDFPMGF